MSDTYFGGKSAFDGKQFALQATSFKECVDRYINVPVVLRVTRGEYQKLDIATQKQYKDGPFLTACSFDPETSHRKDEHALKIKLACLDFDSPTEKERDNGYIDYASDFAEDFKALHEALHPFNYVVYSTASSTPQKPRFRIMVDVDNLPKGIYRKVIKSLARKLGVLCDKWSGFKESKVVSQPMYRPNQFQGEDFIAVISSRTSGVPFDEFDIPEDIDEEFADVTGLAFEGADDYQATSIAHLPILGLTLDQAADALMSIDPDASYMTWFKILTALKHQFRGEEADYAYEMFDQWSAEGSKYKGSDETAAKWKSATPEVKGKIPVTIRSLFKIAIDEGWDSNPMAAEFQLDLETWMVQAEVTDLMSEGPEKIAALPFINPIVEDSLIIKLKDAIKAQGGATIEKTTIRKAVRSERRRSLSEVSEENMPQWLRPWVFVSPENCFRNMGNGLVLPVAAFNNTYAKELLKDDDDGIGKPSMAPSDYALNVIQTKRVEGVLYDPRQNGTEPFFTYQGLLCFNEFLPSSVPSSVPHNAKKAKRIFRELLLTLTGKEEYVEMLWDYFAWWVQNPGHKIKWSPLIQSAQGGGKSMLGDIMQAIFGFANTKIVEPGSITSDFNDWAVGCTALVVEEMFVPGHDRMRAMNSMKTLVTNETISGRIKNESMRVMLNTTNVVFFTNFHSALFMEESDRRFMVIESPLQTKADVAEVNATGFWNKAARLKGDLAGALRYALEEYEVPENFPVQGPAPMTEFRKDSVFQSKPDILVAIEDAIADEDVLTVSSDLIMTKRLMEILGTQATGKKLAIQLMELGYRVHDSGKRFSFGNKERTTIWVHRTRFQEDLDSPEGLITQRLGEEVGQLFS